MKVEISEMSEEDFPHVKNLERIALAGAWPQDIFWSELFCNHLSHYCVAKTENLVIGYGGVWLVLDEAHITTMAVNPECRRCGIGSRILLWLLDLALEKGIRRATLEVRESNDRARKLYETFGFKEAGIRKHYYLDNSENAVIMWTDDLCSEESRKRLCRIREKLSVRSA